MSTKQEILDSINSALADNTSGAITPAHHRGISASILERSITDDDTNDALSTSVTGVTAETVTWKVEVELE